MAMQGTLILVVCSVDILVLTNVKLVWCCVPVINDGHIITSLTDQCTCMAMHGTLLSLYVTAFYVVFN